MDIDATPDRFPFAVNLIKLKARQLVGWAGFTSSDRDDIEQELWLDLIARMPRFDAGQGCLHHFIHMVVNNHVSQLIRARTASNRDYRRCRGSLDAPLRGGDGKSCSMVDTIDREGARTHIAVSARSETDRLDLCIDLKARLPKLSEENRRLCWLLQDGLNIAEISRLTGLTRQTIYRRLDEMRQVFSGAQEYL